MGIPKDIVDGIAVLAPQGQVDGNSAPALESALLAGGEARVVLDLAGVEYMSSAGLRLVVLVSKRLKQRGGSLVLCGLQPLVREVFEVSGLAPMLAIGSDRAAALARLAPPA